MWANHSHAERTANLQYHHAQRQSERGTSALSIPSPPAGVPLDDSLRLDR